MTPLVLLALIGAAIVTWIIIAIVSSFVDDCQPRHPATGAYPDYGVGRPVTPRPQPHVVDWRAPELRPTPPSSPDRLASFEKRLATVLECLERNEAANVALGRQVDRVDRVVAEIDRFLDAGAELPEAA